MPTDNTTLLQRFWSKVRTTPGFGPWKNCYIWTGAIGADGYGLFCPEHGVTYRAHRWIYEQTTGTVLGSNQGLHKCDVALCVRPDHIEPGDQKKNMSDCSERGRIQHGQRHYKATLSTEQIEEIRIDHRLHREIADDYGVCRTLVTRIKNGTRRRRG